MQLKVGEHFEFEIVSDEKEFAALKLTCRNKKQSSFDKEWKKIRDNVKKGWPSWLGELDTV